MSDTILRPAVFTFLEESNPCGYWASGSHIVSNGVCRCGKRFSVVHQASAEIDALHGAVNFGWKVERVEHGGESVSTLVMHDGEKARTLYANWKENRVRYSDVEVRLIRVESREFVECVDGDRR